jgi:3-hydroxyacyl-CoA dehydrogenase / enoyl-CoA hydratase / 3-hydroxybutyryl-CoA epimerase
MSGKQQDQAALALEVSGDRVAWLVFDRPDSRVNILTSEVMARLDALLGEIEAGAAAGRIRAVVIRSGKDGSFIAGADVNEIAGITNEAAAAAGAAAGQRVFRRLDLLPVPTVAAVDGMCLGGGTELILACDARIASDRPETRIGLPEVRLGIIPGFGGTTRLPRVIGMSDALGMILTGSSVSARRAQRTGLIGERIHAAALYDRARELALDLAVNGPPPRRKRPLVKRLLDGTRVGRHVVLRQARRQVLRQTKGRYPAPLEALRVVKKSATLQLDAALAVEAEAVGRLVVTAVSRNLIHVFHLLESAKKAGPTGVEPRPVHRVAVLGAGVMGGGIAQLVAHRGIDVRLKDIDREALAVGLRHARQMFDKLVRRGRLDRRTADRQMNALAPTLDYSGFGTVDVVIEAVVERMDVKQQVMREAESNVRPGCVLATNTSSLSVSELQRAVDRPSDVVGMHFFNPVHRMPLVEVIRGEATSDEAVATVIALTRRLDKTAVLVRDGPGFLVNRILAPYLNEAAWLLAEGGAIQQIDRILRRFGMPMGPLRLLDEVGLDVARHAGAVMSAAFGERLAIPPAITALEGTGLLGRKAGRGFYNYEDGREKGVNESVYAALSLPPRRTELAERNVLDRTLLVMVNEAARVLEDGITDSAGAVDLAMITGTGFPPFRGGLLRWADGIGVQVVHERLVELAAVHGPRFEPAPLIRERATAGVGFY